MRLRVIPAAAGSSLGSRPSRGPGIQSHSAASPCSAGSLRPQPRQQHIHRLRVVEHDARDLGQHRIAEASLATPGVARVDVLLAVAAVGERAVLSMTLAPAYDLVSL
jgi:hypothetical protein